MFFYYFASQVECSYSIRPPVFTVVLLLADEYVNHKDVYVLFFILLLHCICECVLLILGCTALVDVKYFA